MRADRLKRLPLRRRRRRSRRIFSILGAGAAAYAAASWLAARVLARRLISAEGLAPPREQREELFASLERSGARVAGFRHPGSVRGAVALAAVFASPGDPSPRPTILFIHGKGGSGAEWLTEALRALALGYNALLPDLRGHGESGGEFVTYGFLEKEDLANALAAAAERFGIDTKRIGVHACSAGCAAALELAADRESIRALWLESPFGEAGPMARHYLSLATGLPERLLDLTARWAVRRASVQISRALGVAREDVPRAFGDPLPSLARVRGAVSLVYGAEDGLVPPSFVRRFEEALPPGSEIWKAPAAGHCHHENEPARVASREYGKRWREFFGRHLPVGA